MGMRGSIPRRKPDPSRRPEPRPIIQKTPQHFYHDAGDVTIPSNGAAKIFETRFARAGVIESPSLSVSGIPDGVEVWLNVLDEKSDILFSHPLSGNGRSDFQNVPVSTGMKYSLWLVQKGTGESITITADIVFVFQEK